MRDPRRRSSFLLPVALLCAAGASFLTGRPREANASVSIAASLEDLARASSVIAKITPLEHSSAWENGRIVTTTRVRVDEVVAGAVPTKELRVRTLGGRVDTIGQLVEGEASFAQSEPSVVFLKAVPGPLVDAAFVVAGRAQGQLVVRRDVHGREVVRVGAVGELVQRRVHPPLRAGGRPITELDGALLQAVSIEAKRAFEVGHAK